MAACMSLANSGPEGHSRAWKATNQTEISYPQIWEIFKMGHSGEIVNLEWALLYMVILFLRSTFSTDLNVMQRGFLI